MPASPHVRRLTQLIIYHNSLGDEGARLLADSPGLARLTDLDVGWYDIGDAGTRALAESPHLARLTRLRLASGYPEGRNRNAVTDTGAEALAATPHLNRLGWLQMGQPLTGRGVRALRERFGPAVHFD